MPILRFLSPAACPCCEREVFPEEDGCCPGCRGVLDTARISARGRCAVCFAVLGRDGRCTLCAGRRIYFDVHRSLFRLSREWREVLHCWKFENDRRLFRMFRTALGDELERELRDFGPERLVYIASGRSARNLRGYQPCADLAQLVGSRLGVARGGDLVKIDGSLRQSGRGYDERFLGIHNALRYRGSPDIARRILLVEDVFTTGATANEASRTLKKNGAHAVFLLSLFLREEAA